jgi:hypothetical protein
MLVGMLADMERKGDFPYRPSDADARRSARGHLGNPRS